MKIQIAEKKDKEELLKMNRQLMADEQYDRPPEETELSKRWDQFLEKEDFQVLLFREEAQTMGYAVIHMKETPLYLRHFFINPEFRRKGTGTSCFNSMMDFLDAREIDLDAMVWNERGIGFWHSLGFKDRCVSMNLKR